MSGQSALIPPPISAPEVRRLAGEWARGLDDVAREMHAFLTARIPQVSGDPEISDLTLASCASNVEAILSMIRHGIPGSATEAPIAALEHARRMAARGHGIDATLRFYRVGHAYFWERWSAELVGAIDDRERLVTAMRETAAFVFHYIDEVSGQVSTEYLAERERRQRRAAVVRADLVRAVLAGETVDRPGAEQGLGHQFGPRQVAFLCWSDGDPAQLERAAGAVARAHGASRTLMVPEGPHALAGWLNAVGPADPAALLERLREVAPEVGLALGDPGAGIDGFRASHDQARRARRVAELIGGPSPALTAYRDVALIDLLSRDLDAARGFVRAELGELAADDPATRRDRRTLLAVVAPNGGPGVAAHELEVHRNTVLQRVRRAEALRGRSIQERPTELLAALVLADALDRTVLD
ncbi:PucR family transcriptional regulator [Patulibacter medicamentivorans]|uniref:PucR family transcriptional regulator n=1 Tax=Patulibacter medicamentivorans TaxID=1097667 RepID=UPI000A30D19C|nr:helix-turn-helix domain-containing protein [Patulibacter medicamentivorans]